MAEHAGELIDRLAEIISDNNEAKGFWEIPDPLIVIPIKLGLVMGEGGEAMDVHRKAYDDAEEDPLTGMTPMQEDDFTEELADVVIRALDVAGYYELEIGDAIISKIEKNKGRPPKHGRRY